MPTDSEETPDLVADSQLASLVEQCVRSALAALADIVRSGVKPQRTSHFVSIEINVDGKRTRSNRQAPLDYSTLLKGRGSNSWETGASLPELHGFADVEQYLRSVPEYWRCLSSVDHLQNPNHPDWPESWFNSNVRTFIARVVDRHIHTSGWEFNSTAFRRTYASIEPTLRAEFGESRPLTVDVLVPLFGVGFDADRLTDATDIEYLEPAQLAACWPAHETGQADAPLLLSATHVWVQRGVPITFQPLTGWPLPSNLNFEPLDRLLEVVAVSVHHPFGVKHVMYRPYGWADAWVGDLPAGGTWTWTYERLANGLPRSDSPPETVHLTRSDTARRLVALKAGGHELHLAARRLLIATCRTDPLDAVVDSCIGIEALLGDTSPNEITHKLALRSAALLSTFGLADARTVFTTVKRLYRHRSKIVHGSLKPDGDNMIDALGGRFTADSIAVVLLGLLLQAVLDNPDVADRISNDDLILSQLKPRE